MERETHGLNAYKRNVRSGSGEDGIIEKILEILDQKDQWCVEFGAADGLEASNTYHLITKHQYKGVLIEADAGKFRKLQENYKNAPALTLLNKKVGFTQDDGLDTLLSATDIPLQFDVLSIDIDGNDYHVWKAVRTYRPKVVLIEFNPTIPNGVDFVQPPDMNINWGCSALSAVKLAKEKGYELVATTYVNAIFVASEYFHLFNIPDNSVEALRTDLSAVTHIFHGYDGTVFLEGAKQMIWHRLPYDESRIQQIPAVFRKFPPCYSKLEVIFAGLYFLIFRGKIFDREYVKKGMAKLFGPKT